jgi:hypothetical protein
MSSQVRPANARIDSTLMFTELLARAMAKRLPFRSFGSLMPLTLVATTEKEFTRPISVRRVCGPQSGAQYSYSPSIAKKSSFASQACETRPSVNGFRRPMAVPDGCRRTRIPYFRLNASAIAEAST